MIWDLLRDRKGNFSLTTAFLIAPMAALAGFAVDFTNTLMIRSQIEAAADAAALGSISEKSAGVSSALGMAEGDVQSGQDDALKLFNGQLAGMSGFRLVSASAQITKTSNILKSTIFYTVEVPTTFTKAIGKQTITFSGQATAEYTMQTFRDFYLLLDNTPSMGVGATTADINKLVANTKDKCAFACHINNAGVEDKNDYYHLAKKLGVTTRIDVLAQATASLMDTAIKTRTVSNQYRMAIYTFGEKAEDTKLLEVAPLTGDLLSAKTKAAGVQLMTIPYQGYNNDTQTSFDNALTQIKEKIGTQGSGVSSSSPEKVVFFVADGVGDSYKPVGCTKKTTSGRCQ